MIFYQTTFLLSSLLVIVVVSYFEEHYNKKKAEAVRQAFIAFSELSKAANLEANMPSKAINIEDTIKRIELGSYRKD